MIGVNVLLFLLMDLSGAGPIIFSPAELLRWGANYGPALHGPGIVRLVTSEFVHANAAHLVNNVFGLFLAETIVMPATGNVGLVACYLITGVGGALTSHLMHPFKISVGASGPIFGLFGVWIALQMMKDHRLKQRERAGAFLFVGGIVGVNLLLGLAPGIDNAAHIGGLVTGFVVGLLIWISAPKRRRRKAAAE